MYWFYNDVRFFVFMYVIEILSDKSVIKVMSSPFIDQEFNIIDTFKRPFFEILNILPKR